MNTIPCDRDIGQWDRYFDCICGRPSSALAAEAVPYTLFKGRALDLGAGAMNDSIFFLEQGFQSVTAIDASPGSAKYADQVASRFGGRFEFKNSRFSDVEYVPECADLVHSNFALPFHGKTGFYELLKAVTECVRYRGILSIILFGSEDGWKNSKPDIPFFTKDEILKLFKGFEYLVFRETKTEGHTQDRVPKFWHIFKIVARRTMPVM